MSTHAVAPMRNIQPMLFHKISLTVASCQNRRCGIKRIPLQGKPIFCPNCRNALFYERIEKTSLPQWGKGGLNYDG